MDLLADVGVRRAGTWIDACHSTVTDSSKQHGHHGDQDGRDDVALSLIADNAIDAHRRRRLNNHHADDDQVP
jgi:hypothetical protein